MMDPGESGRGKALGTVLLGLVVFLATAVAVRFARDRLGVEIGPLVVVGALLVAIIMAALRRRRT